MQTRYSFLVFVNIVLITVVVILSVSTSLGQNLVINPSFEEYTNCPEIPATIGAPTMTDNYVSSWYRATTASSDYFNNCPDAVSVSTPLNFAGYQYARTGDAYVGFIVGINGSDPTYNEYVEGKLSYPMIDGHRYYCQFWVNLANAYNINAINNFGCYFSEAYVYEESYTSNLHYIIPQIVSNSDMYYDDTALWQKVSGVYSAEGGEEWITIGMFSIPDESNIKNPSMGSTMLYYYLDDVCVMDLDDASVESHVYFDSLCKGSTLEIILSEEGSYEYIWSDGSGGNSIEVNEAGTYWVNVIDRSSCSFRTDTFIIKEKDPIIKTTSSEIIGCAGTPITIGINYFDARSYLWNTGAETEQLVIDKSGVYYVKVPTYCGAYVDSYTVFFQDSIYFNIGIDTTICQGDLIQIGPNEIFGINISYTWNVPAISPFVDIRDSGIYILYGIDHCGNTHIDSIQVFTSKCDDCIYMPNAFSPNGDGLNDVYIPSSACNYASYNLAIYNRFGQRVFDATDENDGWDGTYNGMKVDAGTYFYLLIATTTHKKEKIVMKGDITLIR